MVLAGGFSRYLVPSQDRCKGSRAEQAELCLGRGFLNFLDSIVVMVTTNTHIVFCAPVLGMLYIYYLI